MANSTISGNAAGNAATITNKVDGNGTPSQNPNDVTVTTSNATVSGTGKFFDVSMLAGSDTLAAWNIPWANPSSGADVALDTVNMGDGNDWVELHRSAFYTHIDMGNQNDTLILDNSGGRDVSMGAGNDFTQLDLSKSPEVSEEELSQKVGQDPMHIDGGTGSDTLDLVGDWTVTLASGNFTLDTDYNGVGDSVTNVLRADQYGQVLNMPTLLSGTVQWGAPITLGSGDTVVAQATFSNFETITAVCFAAGTLIDTPDGAVPVETLVAGRAVSTRNGTRTIRWIGKRRLDLIDLMANPKLLPVVIRSGAFGNGQPYRDLRVSPQHRLAVRSKISERIFGAEEVLVPARLLVLQDGIDCQIDGAVREVQYYHFMLDTHEMVLANGIWAETFFPGPGAMSFLTEDAREEVRAIFPELCEDSRSVPATLPLVKGRDARALLARHVKAGKPLWS